MLKGHVVQRNILEILDRDAFTGVRATLYMYANFNMDRRRHFIILLIHDVLLPRHVGDFIDDIGESSTETQLHMNSLFMRIIDSVIENIDAVTDNGDVTTVNMRPVEVIVRNAQHIYHDIELYLDFLRDNLNDDYTTNCNMAVSILLAFGGLGFELHNQPRHHRIMNMEELVESEELIEAQLNDIREWSQYGAPMTYSANTWYMFIVFLDDSDEVLHLRRQLEWVLLNYNYNVLPMLTVQQGDRPPDIRFTFGDEDDEMEGGGNTGASSSSSSGNTGASSSSSSGNTGASSSSSSGRTGTMKCLKCGIEKQ